MKIPYLSLSRLHETFFPDLSENLKKSINFESLIGGDGVSNFEYLFQKYVSSKHCIGVGNGFDAIRIALIASGIKPGDDVLVSAHTCIPTWLAITSTGANIVPVDSSEDGYLVDLNKVYKKITPKTKAVVLVHIYGEPIDLAELYAFLKEKNIILIDDAAQAHGATSNREKIGSGTYSDMTAWSFYPTKNLGALGDAGAITTNNADYASRARMLRNYGSIQKNIHTLNGFNSRLDAIQGLALSLKIKKIDLLNSRRKKIVDFYLNEIKNCHIKLPTKQKKEEHAWHIFAIRCPNRKNFISHLNKNGIEPLIHYPTPPHKQQSYSDFNNHHLPNTEKISKEVLSLPIGPYLQTNELNYIVETINCYTSN